MLSIYPACFFKETNGYSVIFPDLNWLSTCGTSFEDAMVMAVDCLAGYLYGLNREDALFPVASHITSIDVNAIAQELELNPADCIVNYVSVDVYLYAKEHFEKSVKKTLTIPAWLNTAALAQQINFSQVLQEALINKIQMK